METKRIITGLIAAAVITGLITCPALARRYDTMMVGPDRWIDIGYLDVHCQKSKETVPDEIKNETSREIALKECSDQEPEITYDGQLEPNTVTLIYYPDEHPEPPEHPNSLDYEEDIEPNLVLIQQDPEHPEHPNSIDYQKDIIEAENLSIYTGPEHPKEPNLINTDEKIEPNDIDRIIHDEGTAYIKRERSNTSKSS